MGQKPRIVRTDLEPKWHTLCMPLARSVRTPYMGGLGYSVQPSHPSCAVFGGGGRISLISTSFLDEISLILFPTPGDLRH